MRFENFEESRVNLSLASLFLVEAAAAISAESA